MWRRYRRSTMAPDAKQLRRAVARGAAHKLIARWTQSGSFEARPDVVQQVLRFATDDQSSPFARVVQQLALHDLVTMVVPAYNAAAYVAETLDSLLAQTHPRLQIIAVDDGSTDNTAAVLARYQADHGVEVLALPENKGLSYAKNEGLARARGEWVGFLSADDVYYPHAISRLLTALHTNAEADIAYADFEYRGEADYVDSSEVAARLGPVHLESLFAPGVTVGMCALFRRSLLSGWPRPVDEDPEMKGIEDTVLWQDLWARASFIHVPGVLGAYRRHGQQLTRDIIRTTGYRPLLLRSRERYIKRNGPFRRLLFVYPWCCIGGAERVMAQLAVGLRQHNVLCEACFLEDGGGSEYFRSICPTTILDEVPGGRDRTRALAEFMRKGNYDLVHYSFVAEMQEAVRLAGYTGPLVEVEHGAPERCQADRVHPDALITVSRHQAQVLSRSGTRTSARVIYNGTDTAPEKRLAAAVAATVPPPPRPIVAWIGRLSDFKRPRLFLQIVRRLCAARPNVDFAMVCGVGPYTGPDELEALIAACRAYPRLRLLRGLHPGEMPVFYALVAASGGIIITTSRNEPFGLVVIEAMAAGIPVIGSASGGITEIITNGVDGVLIPEPYSVAAACDALNALLDDPDRYREISCQARAAVTERFSLDRMVSDYWQLYSSLCGWHPAECLPGGRSRAIGPAR